MQSIFDGLKESFVYVTNRRYDAIIRNEVQKIGHTVRAGETYKPYKYT